jgi:aspartate racemase
MHIGMIGGIGPAATEFYYRGLIARHAKAGTELDLTIAHADVRELSQNVANRDAEKQAAIFARLIERLAAAGAGAAAITSMAGHFTLGELEPISALPLINALPAVNAAIKERRLGKIGILGTRMVMESRFYGAIASVEFVLPEGEDLEAVHMSYVEMARTVRVTEAQRQTFFRVGLHLCKTKGAEAVMLGGTDLFLAFDGRDPGFPVIDCADIHVEAIYRRSVERM